jgi:hypothetical protein
MAMTVTLDTLELTPAELECCKDIVRRMAYFNWLDAGCPDGQELDCWLLAERAWIEHFYVPDRPYDGARPQDTTPPETPADNPDRAEQGSGKSPRRARAKA